MGIIRGIRKSSWRQKTNANFCHKFIQNWLTVQIFPIFVSDSHHAKIFIHVEQDLFPCVEHLAVASVQYIIVNSALLNNICPLIFAVKSAEIRQISTYKK